MARITDEKRNVNNLTDKWQVFCDTYLENGLNQTEAYKAAYPKASQATAEREASRLIRKAEVALYLSTRMAEIMRKSQITQDDVLKDLIELKEKCMGRIESEVLVEFMGTADSENHKVFNPAGAKAALELLGKYLDMWKGDKQDNPLGVVAIPVPAGMTIDEWQRLYYPPSQPG